MFSTSFVGGASGRQHQSGFVVSGHPWATDGDGRVSVARRQTIHDWLLLESVHARTSRVSLSMTPTLSCHLEERQAPDLPILKAEFVQFDPSPCADPFATRTPTALADSFDLNDVGRFRPIAIVLLPCGFPSTCEHGPESSCFV